MKTQDNSYLVTGPIAKSLTKFALPIMLGQLFQQLYNVADSLIVGNFLDSTALAAVTSTGSLIFLMIGFFGGLSIGGGVVIARFFGAKDIPSLRKAIHTQALGGVICGIILTVIGMTLAPEILKLMGTPDSVFPLSTLYLRWYFAGSLGFIMYNTFVGIIQSLGDSRHPLYYLIFSACINVVLDLLFVAVMDFGVASAAIATSISQLISAGLCLYRLMRKVDPDYAIKAKELKLDGGSLSLILKNGIPAGLQNSIISIANVFVQSNINSFGPDAMAGIGAYSKIEGFGFLPITCFSMSLTTFISQNLGANETARVKKGIRFGILCSITMAEIIGALIFISAPVLISLFDGSGNPDVIYYGSLYARTTTLFYFLLAFSHCMAAIFRGAGKATVPMFVMLGCWCVIRITYISIALSINHSLTLLAMAYPITWSLSAISFSIYYFKGKWLNGINSR